MIVKGGVDRDELLQPFHPSKTLRCALSSSEQQVTIFGLIVQPAPLAKAEHPAYLLLANISREHRAEPVQPQTYGCVTDIDAALEQ